MHHSGPDFNELSHVACLYMDIMHNIVTLLLPDWRITDRDTFTSMRFD
jgi:hypothetical protein